MFINRWEKMKLDFWQLEVTIKYMERKSDKDLEYLQVGRRYKDLRIGLMVLGILVVLGVVLQQCS